MSTVRIYGASDDLVIFSVDAGADEVGCSDAGVEFMVTDSQAPGAIVVTMQYAPEGAGAVWQAAVRQAAEDHPFPGTVTVEVEPERRYSSLVTITTPGKAAVTHRRLDLE